MRFHPRQTWSRRTRYLERGQEEIRHTDGGMNENHVRRNNRFYSKVKHTLTPVGAAPQVSDNLVDLIHLHAVEFHDGSAESKQESMRQTQHRTSLPADADGISVCTLWTLTLEVDWTHRRTQSLILLYITEVCSCIFAYSLTWLQTKSYFVIIKLWQQQFFIY